MNYSEKLKDPRWQKKRLEILKRDGWKCRACTEDKKTLHVHHITYDPDFEPWEYEDLDLVTLCEDCHKVLHLITNFMKKINCDFSVLYALTDLLMRIESEKIKEFFTKKEKQKGF